MTTPEAGGGDSAMNTALSDAEVMAVLAASDTGEIMQGNLAQMRAADARVRSFGADMVSMHTASSMRLMALGQRLGITPRDNPLSQMLASEATDAQQRLSNMTGAAFDREYVNVQVMQHARVLDILDSALLPNARNDELRMALQNDVRPMVATHLQQARTLQTALGSP